MSAHARDAQLARLDRLYRKELVSWAERNGRDADAEDLVQDVFIELSNELEKRGDGSELVEPRAWLRKRLKLRVLDAQRGDARKGSALEKFGAAMKRTLSVHISGPVMASAHPSDRPDAQLRGDEAARAVYDITEKLPPRAAQVFRLSILDSLSVQEVAQELGLKEKSVRVVRERATAAVKVELTRRGLTPTRQTPRGIAARAGDDQ